MIQNLFAKCFLFLATIACAVLLLPGQSANTLPKSLDAFATLDSLNVSTFEHFGSVPGPESIAHFNGKLVTGSVDGHLYQIVPSSNAVERLTKVPQFKSRPLGLKFDSRGVLFVVAISTGVYQVEDVFSNNPKISLAFDIQQTATLPGGKASLFLNDVAVAEKANGHILFISDISSKYPPDESFFTFLLSDKGRVVRYDTESKEVSELKSSFVTPNGLEVTPDNKALLFVELAPRTVWRYSLVDGSLKQIMSQLPGEPDNIRRSAKGDTFWIAIMNPRSQRAEFGFSALDFLMSKPLLRKLTVQVVPFAGQIVEKLGSWLPESIGNRIEEVGRSMKTLQILFPVIFPSNGAMMLEIDINGSIVSSIYSHNEPFSMISEVREIASLDPTQRVFYLASVEKSYIRKLVITK